MAKYLIASQEGAERYGVELGEVADLDITKDEELAVVAAGWLEHAAEPAKEKK